MATIKEMLERAEKARELLDPNNNDPRDIKEKQKEAVDILKGEK